LILRFFNQFPGVDVDGTLLRELRRGACFGERALLFSEPRSAKASDSLREGISFFLSYYATRNLCFFTSVCKHEI